MGQTTGFLTKSLTATTAIPARTIVKFGASDGTGVPAVDGAAFMPGISSDIDTAVGQRATYFGNGNIAEVIYGGTVARGDELTSDASGRAIKAAPGAGINMFCVGFAEVSGVVGDIGTAFVAPFIKQG
jgi:hypothetical protein